MLKIEGLQKSFITDDGRRVDALRGVSIDVEAGEFFTLIGPSGSGKSTAMRCVAGLEHPEAGEIYIGDECVFSSARGIRVAPDERPIGMVFQSYAIWPHMDVRNNVAFPLLYGVKGKRQSKAEINAAVDEALRLVQMDGYQDRPSTQLSGGQQQRVALARALVRHPKLLLLDEPLSNLDAKLREEMRIELKELTSRVGITSFFVTHDQLEALAMSERVGVIMEGELIAIGRPAEMYTQTDNRRVATFLGIANTLEGKLSGNSSDRYLETGIGPLHVASTNGCDAAGTIAVAVRPEAVVCTRERPAAERNVFKGTVSRATFLGSFVDGEVVVNGQTLRVNLSPYGALAQGDQVYVQIPAERCQILK